MSSPRRSRASWRLRQELRAWPSDNRRQQLRGEVGQAAGGEAAGLGEREPRGVLADGEDGVGGELGVETIETEFLDAPGHDRLQLAEQQFAVAIHLAGNHGR